MCVCVLVCMCKKIFVEEGEKMGDFNPRPS